MEELGISLQVYQAATAWLIGFAFGIVYDLLKTLNRAFRTRKLAYCLDALFCVLLLTGVFVQTMYLGRGYLRIFMLLANILGFFLYCKVLSPHCLPIFTQVLDKMLKIIQFALKPIRQICAISRKVYIMLKKSFHQHRKRYIIKYKSSILERKKKRRKAETDEKQTRKHHNQVSRRGVRGIFIRHTDQPARTNRGNGSQKRRNHAASHTTRRRK